MTVPEPTGGPRIFTDAYYDRLHEIEERHWWAFGMRYVAARLLDPYLRATQPLRVLDAGCGTGGMLAWLQRRARPERLVGIDLAERALVFCRQRRMRHLVRASVTRLPFPDEAFDLVVCLDVIQHLPRNGSDGVALAEFRRVLRPGGVLFLRTNVQMEPSSEEADAAPPRAVPEDFHRYSRREVAQALQASGLRIERLSYANALPSLASTWLARFGCGPPPAPTDRAYRGLTMRTPPGWLNVLLRGVMYCEAAYLGVGRRVLPRGHSIVGVARRPVGDRPAVRASAPWR